MLKNLHIVVILGLDILGKYTELKKVISYFE